MSDTKTCFTCAYKENVPGDCHVRCRFDWRNSGLITPQASDHGRAMGWYMFPFNYDPIWQLEECKAHSTVRDEKKLSASNVIEDMMSLFAR